MLVPTGTDITATATLDQELYPTAPAVTLTSENVATVTSWGSAVSTNPADANTTATVTAFAATATFSNYVAKQSFMVGRAADTSEPTNGLRMASISITADAGISVIVVCGTNIYTYTAIDAALTDALAANTAVTITGVQVDVYIFINGADAAVYTNNMSALTGSVSMTFTVNA